MTVQTTQVAVAAPPALHVQSRGVVILELFTSEGCSSCPPADELLRSVNGTQTADGQLIVGISEHVTYWNRLGWTDLYSDEAFTSRQASYANRLSPEGAYTPQMVLNGREQIVGSDGAALRQALQDEAHRRPVVLSVLHSAVEGDYLTVRFGLAGAPPDRTLDLIAVWTDDMDRSNVLRGENSGRNLQHVSVARELIQVGSARGDTEQTVRLAVPPRLRTDSGGHHLILFAQEQHQGAIVGATTMPL